jgi:aryl-alcohol dehydrogenase-like predicted oxidoreductase
MAIAWTLRDARVTSALIGAGGTDLWKKSAEL